ncbi:EamA/RhaT family transporter [Paenibacillus antri]|uniref:EamA/RhaT family transporter n=2 Tax=Paenibacillus antri TaxID=2582848 RepID=A0A5R9GFQ4_9BACL|nr:EamA/RhaT family transporter [Paenibacillus antri]
MGMIYLVIASLSWSLVGVLVKTAAFQFDPYTITFARFSIGVLALAGFALATRHSLKPAVLNRWIWVGAIGKSVNYLFENVGVSQGFAYGNVLVFPTQTVVLLLLGIFLFKEKLSGKSWTAAAIVVAGVLLITWNGRPLSAPLGEQGWLALVFIASGVGAALHLFSQKMLLDAMKDVSMNYSIFLWASLLCTLPLPVAADWSGTFVPGAWAAAAALGLITGLSFLLSSKGMRSVKFSVAAIVFNLPVLFTVLWAVVFYREPVTAYIAGGAVVVAVGMTMLNWPSRARSAA